MRQAPPPPHRRHTLRLGRRRRTPHRPPSAVRLPHSRPTKSTREREPDRPAQQPQTRNRTTPQTLAGAGWSGGESMIRTPVPMVPGRLSCSLRLRLFPQEFRRRKGMGRVRGRREVTGSVATAVRALTTRRPATAIWKPTRSDHDGLSHRAAAAAPRPPGPDGSVCSRARIRDGGSTAAGHIEPGPTTDIPPAGHPSPPRWPLLRAQRRWPQSADGWPCKPLWVAAPRRRAGRAPGPGRAAASARPAAVGRRSVRAVPGADCGWWAADVGWRAEWPGGAAERGGRHERAAATGRQRARPAQAGRLDPVKKL